MQFPGVLAQPEQWDFYKQPRLFIRTNGAGIGVPSWDAIAIYSTGDPVQKDGSFYKSQQDENIGNDPADDDGTFWTPTGAPYAWTEQYQNEEGIFSDDPNGLAGTVTDSPAYMADGRDPIEDGTICEAVKHYGGWLIAWPLRDKSAIVATTDGIDDLGTYAGLVQSPDNPNQTFTDGTPCGIIDLLNGELIAEQPYNGILIGNRVYGPFMVKIGSAQGPLTDVAKWVTARPSYVKPTIYLLWNSLDGFLVVDGQVVNYSGALWTAVIPSTNIMPGSDVTVWKPVSDLVVFVLFGLDSPSPFVMTNVVWQWEGAYWTALQPSAGIVPGSVADGGLYFRLFALTDYTPAAYDAIANYSTGDMIPGYISLVDGNIGITPGTDATKWKAISIGAYQGAWNSGGTYSAGDYVRLSGPVFTVQSAYTPPPVPIPERQIVQVRVDGASDSSGSLGLTYFGVILIINEITYAEFDGPFVYIRGQRTGHSNDRVIYPLNVGGVYYAATTHYTYDSTGGTFSVVEVIDVGPRGLTVYGPSGPGIIGSGGEQYPISGIQQLSPVDVVCFDLTDVGGTVALPGVRPGIVGRPVIVKLIGDKVLTVYDAVSFGFDNTAYVDCNILLSNGAIVGSVFLKTASWSGPTNPSQIQCTACTFVLVPRGVGGFIWVILEHVSLANIAVEISEIVAAVNGGTSITLTSS